MSSSHHGRRVRGLSCGSAALAALALGACGSSVATKSEGAPSTGPTGVSQTAGASTTTIRLDTARVAAAITASIEAERHISAKVTCPSDIPQQQGHDFTCVATSYTTVSHKKVPVHTVFTVTQTNNLGNVDYSSPQ